jgi:hypothetical protein
MIKKEWKTCSRGHRFQKSSACPVCPMCWPGYRKKLQSDFPDDLSAPALRALRNAKILSLEKLSQYTEANILDLHGVGPSSLPKLRAALKAENLKFKK